VTGLLLLVLRASLLAAPDTAALRVCADPGNMPLSNQRGEGFQNKVAEALARAMGMRLDYFWYTYYERGLLRNTLNAGNCDVLLDVPDDMDGALVTKPYYKSTYVMAYRVDRNLHPASLDDPVLKQIHIGVFQTSPARDVLREHGIVANTVVHYVFYDSYYHPEQHPAEQIDAVIAGTLDAVTAWGPTAGYAVAKEHAPLTVWPLNTVATTVPLDFSMALAVRRQDGALKARLEQALAEHRDEIRAILASYGVPLVRCDECIISGDLPAQVLHDATPAPVVADDTAGAMVGVRARLAAGTNPTVELNDAVIGKDPGRVRYLLDHGARADSLDNLGYDALHEAIRDQDITIAQLLVEHGAGLETRDREGWTPLMLAVWDGNTAAVHLLIDKGARVNTIGGKGWSPLTLAITYDTAMVGPLLAGGGDANGTNNAGYTPIMFAVVRSDSGLVDRLVQAGARAAVANKAGVTPLMLAVMRNDAAMVKQLLALRVDVNAANAAGDRALGIARQRHFDDVAMLLNSAGAH
jgi:quinoprotein dehydrogenase-associated probable ABC transporter substrate-binding protein